MNALTTYLKDTGQTVSGLAAKMGLAPSTLTRPLRGQRSASTKLARAVEAATEGKVSASDFLSICLSANDAPTNHERAAAE